MADPYLGRYLTAGSPWLAADGTGFASQSAAAQAQYNQAYGLDSQRVWAQDMNRVLLQFGQAIETPHGVISLDNARFALQQAGYNGPLDTPSLSRAYAMLATPAPAPPAPTQMAPVQASATLGGLSLGAGIGGIPRPLLYLGVGLLAYELLFSGRRRLL